MKRSSDQSRRLAHEQSESELQQEEQKKETMDFCQGKFNQIFSKLYKPIF